MLTAPQTTELSHYFAIKTDLRSAALQGHAENFEFHINELQAMHTHTDNFRLRLACTATISEYQNKLAKTA